jgi:hypothetical protein
MRVKRCRQRSADRDYLDQVAGKLARFPPHVEIVHHAPLPARGIFRHSSHIRERVSEGRVRAKLSFAAAGRVNSGTFRFHQIRTTLRESRGVYR